MKGVIRKTDQLGRIVIPKEMRDFLEIKEKTSLDIYMNEDKIILEKHKVKCCKQCLAKGEKSDNFCRNCGSKI